MDKACYTEIIGLSKEGCLDCFNVAPDTNSLSGLYLDQLEALSSIEEIKPCKDITLWAVMGEAREQGTIRFMGDANGMLASRYKSNRGSWSGFLGRTTHLESYEKGAGNYAGIRIKPAPISGGTLRIKAINTLFRETGNIVVKIYDSLNRLLHTNTVAVIAGYQVNPLPTPILLPLYDALLGQNLEYFIVYESLKEASLNEAYCTCGGFNVQYNCERSYAGMEAKSMENRWSQWMMLGGWEGTTLTDFHDAPHTAPSYCYGLILDGDIYCNSSEVLCKGSIKFDGSNTLAFSIAYAILYAAADHLAMRILTSTKLTRSIIMNRDTLIEARKEFNEKYIEHISYVCDNLDIAVNDCLGCQSDLQMGISKILI